MENNPTKNYNVLLIVVDQERYFEEWPFPLPAREEIKKHGISFVNHQAASCVCSSARSVIYTGHHIQQTGIFDNIDFVWQKDLNPQMPTLGTYFQKLGYHSVYRGKWHLSRTMDEADTIENVPWKDYSEVMKKYGFDDYVGIGDMLDGELGGYYYDSITLGLSQTWLKDKGRRLNMEGKPWFMALNFVNPHDSMFFDSDKPGEEIQSSSAVFPIAKAPNDEIFNKSWENVPLPASRRQPINEKGRPSAHAIYENANSTLVGNWPNEDHRWRGLQDFYFNCMRDVDTKIQATMDTLKEISLLDKTIVIFTADHGELGGYHGLRNKGTTAYKEQNHIPLMIVHPDFPGGKTCKAMTSQLDITPTILGMVAKDDQGKDLINGLKGHNFSEFLANPESAGTDSIRPATLYNFDMLAFSDGRVWAEETFASKKFHSLSYDEQLEWMEKFPPDLNHRTAIRSIYNGRYRYSRYFASNHFGKFQNFEELIANNDLELYDLQNDPEEMNNLAADPHQHKELIMQLQQQLDEMIKKEVGVDDGSFLPIKDGKLHFDFISK